ncbi:hypothetical protein PR202_ga13852 [Eleusine coracana subsp. coracana]|uniref:Exocyst component Exo84 C-terminal domain-containing protein n=1 Tax=Eleusine coracana subsp. coracana TaxID=191504 RepID=A0AAV5CF27_ELECO|nr:hypothetical protein PR202_ga13852 [Eleusine coracana subsp. coracana]
MSSAKSSRSRPSGHSGVFPVNAAAGAVGGDGGVHADKLKIFKTDNFDPDSYVQSKCRTMTEKVRSPSYLKKASAEEMRKSVYANYAAFIRTSKEISNLEGELLSTRNLLSTQSALIHSLSEGVHIDSLTISLEDYAEQDTSLVEDQEPSELQKWCADFPDMLDVLLAERRVDEALDALDEAERIAADAKQKEALTTADIMALNRTISENRQKLADQLAEAACQSSTRGVELRAAASALKRLGDGPRAHSLLLSAHDQRLKLNMQTIHPSSTTYGGAYTASLAQQVFSVIARALSDSVEVFGDESSYASELVTWATKQAMSFALLVKRHALASCAAGGGLRAVAECVQIALGYSELLETRGLSLSAVLMKQFRPSVEQALESSLRRIGESTAALASADDWVLTHPPTGIRPFTRSSAGNLAIQPKLSSSAHCFNSMVQDFFEDVRPLVSLQLGGSILDGLLQIFDSYVNLLISALPGSVDDEVNLEGLGNRIVRMAETEEQQLALLANASLLAEELLPRAAMKLYSTNQARMDSMRIRGPDKPNRAAEQREWKRKLHRTVDKLRDSFCRQHALELIFTDEGGTHLSAEMYIYMDSTVEEPEWVPSLIFQSYCGSQKIRVFGKILKRDQRPLVPLDFNSVLPSDDWFIDVAHDAISRISGKPRFSNGEREVNSPTASVSAQSVSSVRSHGSS